MGFFDKLVGGKSEDDKVPNLQEVMDEDGDVVSPPADFYVKKLDLRNEGDVDLALKELADGNIIILNVLPIAKQENRLKTIIGKIKANSRKINGDIARLDEKTAPHLILLTPGNVKIVKSKQKPKSGTMIS